MDPKEERIALGHVSALARATFNSSKVKLTSEGEPGPHAQTLHLFRGEAVHQPQ
jgi:hypothetical protein